METQRKSMKVTLAETSSNGEIDPELPIFYNQARLLLEAFRHQFSHKIFDLQFFPIYKLCREKDKTEFEGRANQ